MRNGGVGDQLLQIALRQTDHRRVDDVDHAEHRDRGRERSCGGRKHRPVHPQHSVDAHLEQDARQDHRDRRRCLDVRIGQPGVQRHHRHFHREGDEHERPNHLGEGDAGEERADEVEKPGLTQLGDRQHVEGVAAEGPIGQRIGPGLVLWIHHQRARGDESSERLWIHRGEPLQQSLIPGPVIQGEDRQQQENGAGQGEKEELDCRVLLARTAPDPDQEVHRQQHHFPEDEEEEHVQRREGARHSGLQNQKHRHVARHLHHREMGVLGIVVLVLPAPPRHRCNRGDEGDQGGENDHRDADPVDADEILDVQTGDPASAFDELDLSGGAAVVDDPEIQTQNEGHARADQRHPAAELIARRLGHGNCKRSSDRHNPDDGGKDDEAQ